MLKKIVKNGENEKTESKKTFRYDVKAENNKKCSYQTICQ